MSKLLVGLDDQAAATCANDMILAKEIADTLNSHYPGHLWGVNVQGEQGVADIFDLMVSGEMGYRIKLVNMYSASQLKRNVIQAGGEILERFRLARGRFDESQYVLLKTDHSGRFQYER